MTSPRLIPETMEEGTSVSHRADARDSGRKHSDRVLQTRRSALWAAYGDALGWISELANEAGLRRRTAGIPLSKPVEWKRRVGGRAGVTVSLPQGCYSDDSQLRLATGRAIRSDGFDVEAFAKVELPVWLGYALGGGKSTSTAATNLAKSTVPWYANTFKGWTNSGGNGAAMRIQPHVWAAHTPGDAETYLPDVIRNAICTHSHPNGLIGAILHAVALAHAVDTGLPPSPEDLMSATEIFTRVPETMQKDTEVGTYWRTTFDRESAPFNNAWARTIDECQEAIQAAADASRVAGEEGYDAVVNRLRLRDPARRGSGMLTAVAAMGLIWCEPQAEESMRIAANAIGTDTDTIATMAGAILGMTAETDPPVEVLDADLFRSEADRLAEISSGGNPHSHRYPDLLHWSAPKTRADSLKRSVNGLHVLGLGHAEAIEEPIPSPQNRFMWQWIRLETGQTLLIKRRNFLESSSVSSDTVPPTRHTGHTRVTAKDSKKVGLYTEKAPDVSVSNNTRKGSPHEPELDSEFEEYLVFRKMVDYLKEHKNDDRRVGIAIRRVINKGDDGQIAAFLAVVVKELQKSTKPSV